MRISELDFRDLRTPRQIGDANPAIKPSIEAPMKAFQYHTTNQANALAILGKLRAAGYTFGKHPRNAGRPLPPMTFNTAAYVTKKGERIYYISWAYSKKAPLPPRRKLGRGKCTQCGKRRQHARGLCPACRFRERYHTDAEFRERQLAKSRKKMAQLYSLPEYRAKRAKYQAVWARNKRRMQREAVGEAA